MYYFHIFSNWYTEWAKHSGTFNYSSIYALKYALMDLPSQLLDKPLGKPHSPSVPFRLKKKKKTHFNPRTHSSPWSHPPLLLWFP